jgi:cytochrome c-type biogenesis protein CcmH
MIFLRRILLIGLLFAAMIPQALAVQPDEVLNDPALEARARELSAQMRCLVCQNQSIDDSDAPLAKDLRVLIRERLTNGDSNDQVVDYLVSRYGEFVLLKPRFTVQTMILWAGPFAILLIGGLMLWRNRRSSPVSAPETTLTDEERKQLKRILKDGT